MSAESNTPYVRSIELLRDEIESYSEFPFSVPAISKLSQLSFHPKVTFFVGENGSGKSTLLEAIAVCLKLNPEGGSRHLKFATANTHSQLHTSLKVVKGARMPKDVFFLRAESFYNVATALDNIGLRG